MAGRMVAKRIKAVRNARAMSQLELAVRVPGLDPVTLAKIESGRLAAKPEILDGIAEALGVSSKQLAGR